MDEEEKEKCIQDRFREKLKYIQDKLRSIIAIAEWYDALVIILMSAVAYIVIGNPKSYRIDVSTIHGAIVRGSSAFLALSLASTVFYVNLAHLWRGRIREGIDGSIDKMALFARALTLDSDFKDALRESLEHALEVQKITTEWEQETRPMIKKYFIASFAILASCIVCSLILMLLKYVCPFPIHIIFMCTEIIFIYVAFRLVVLIIYLNLKYIQ